MMQVYPDPFIQLPLAGHLALARCPHCRVDTPSLVEEAGTSTTDFRGKNERVWVFYACSRCGGIVTAYSNMYGGEVLDVFPSYVTVDESVPKSARSYLEEAIEAVSSPTASILVCNSSIDEMLKLKGYTVGSLYSRIDQAVKSHLLTPEMGVWAHEVRLTSNELRHADEQVLSPTIEDARRLIRFALALAEFVFVLPSKVQRGILESKSK